jgi:hypothetical protein
MRTLRPAVLLLAAALGAGVLAGCSSGSDNPTIQGSPTPAASASGAATATATPAPAVTTAAPATPSPTVARSPSTPTPTKATVGAYTTIQSAETYAQSKSDQAGGAFDFIGADSTWRPAATLHVLRGMPAAAAGNGGDYFFFFVNGNPVGQFHFTGAIGERAPDATSFAITYGVYKPGDPHCCPTGGNATVTFRWDGSKLVHDPAPGATQN